MTAAATRKRPAPRLPKANKQKGSLSVTALYTAQAWVFGGFEDADLYESHESRQVYKIANYFLWLLKRLKPGPNYVRSLAQRHAMFDRVVEQSGATQVVEIAAGFSQRGTVFSRDPDLRYVETDIPEVVTLKRQVLPPHPAGP